MVESKKKAGANARVYEVTSPDGKRVLVRASSPAQALRHVVEEDKFRVEVVNAIDVVDYVAAGGVVQDATSKAASASASEANDGAEPPPRSEGERRDGTIDHGDTAWPEVSR